MKTKILVLKLIAASVIAVATQNVGTALAADKIRIGLAGPHTGPYATIGDNISQGAGLAAKHINKAGGINGRMVEIVNGDDACEPKQAVAVANRMVEVENVNAVIGHICSSGTLPASEIYEDAGLVNMTPGSTNPLITERGLELVFRMIGRDDQQGKVAADFVIDRINAKRIAVVHDKDSYGQGLADAMIARLKARGENDRRVLYEGLTRGEKDFNALVTKIRSVGADALYFGGTYTEAGPLVRQLREQGAGIPFISGDGTFNPEFITTAGGAQFAKGSFLTFGRDPKKSPYGKAVVAEFNSKGYDPDGFTLYAYAAVQALTTAMKKMKSTNGKQISLWLKANKVDTILGSKEWDKKGDLTVEDYVVYTVTKDGKFKEIE